MTYAFVALALAQLGALVTVTVWYHLANKRADAVRDLLDGERVVRVEAEHQRDVALVALSVANDQLGIERNLRAIAETQRNEAQRKARDLLRQHMRTATDDEIRETVADLLTSPLAVVPRAPVSDRVQPEGLKLSDAPGTALLDPFPDV